MSYNRKKETKLQKKFEIEKKKGQSRTAGR